MSKIKVLLVEDNLDLANNIKEILENLEFNVVGIFDQSDLVLNYLKLNTVDLLLVDIMIKGNHDGIELARQVRLDYKIPLVFITAFSENEILRRALEVEPDGYLLKPFNKENLKTTLALAYSSFGLKTEKLKNSTVDNKTLQIRDKGFKILINTDDVVYAKADGLYTKIFTRGKSYVVRDILKDIETKLPADEFLRVHKSYLVNKNHIKSFNGKFVVVEDQFIPIRKGYFKILKSLLS
jgi:two-component system, LytTR family, response regulator LytT